MCLDDKVVLGQKLDSVISKVISNYLILLFCNYALKHSIAVINNSSNILWNGKLSTFCKFGRKSYPDDREWWNGRNSNISHSKES